MRKRNTLLAMLAVCGSAYLANAEELDYNALVPAVIKVESNGNPDAESSAGARGLMQIMEPTWGDMTDESWGKAFDPELNVQVGTKYLHWVEKFIRRNGVDASLEQVAAGYNGGVGNLKKNGWDVNKMPKESRDYAIKVRKQYEARRK